MEAVRSELSRIAKSKNSRDLESVLEKIIANQIGVTAPALYKKGGVTDSKKGGDGQQKGG